MDAKSLRVGFAQNPAYFEDSPTQGNMTPSPVAASPRRPPDQLWRKLRLAVLFGGTWLSAYASLPPPGAVSMGSIEPPSFHIGDCLRLARVVPKAVVGRFVAPHAAAVSGTAAFAVPSWCTLVVVRVLEHFHSVAFIATVFWYVIVTEAHCKMPEAGSNPEQASRRAEYINALACNASFHYGMLFTAVLREQSPLTVHHLADAFSECVIYALRSEFPSEADVPFVTAVVPSVRPVLRAWLVGFGPAAALGPPGDGKGRSSPTQSPLRQPTHLDRGPSEKERRRRAYSDFVKSGQDTDDESGEYAANSPQQRSRKKQSAPRALHGRLVARTLFFMRPVPKCDREDAPERRDVSDLYNLPIAEVAVEQNSRLDVVDVKAIPRRTNTTQQRSSAAAQLVARQHTAAATTRYLMESEVAQKTELAVQQCAPLMAIFLQGVTRRAELHNATHNPHSQMTNSSLDAVENDVTDRAALARLLEEHGGAGAFASLDSMATMLHVQRTRVRVGDIVCPSCPLDDFAPSTLVAVGFQLARAPPIATRPWSAGRTAVRVPSKDAGADEARACELCGRNSLGSVQRRPVSAAGRPPSASRSTGIALRHCRTCQHVFCESCCKHRVRQTAAADRISAQPAPSSLRVASAGRKSGRRLPDTAGEVFGAVIGEKRYDCPPPPTPADVLQHGLRRSSEASMRRRSTIGGVSGSGSFFINRGAVPIKKKSAEEQWRDLEAWVAVKVNEDRVQFQSAAATLSETRPVSQPLATEAPAPSAHDSVNHEHVSAPVSPMFVNSSFGEVLYGGAFAASAFAMSASSSEPPQPAPSRPQSALPSRLKEPSPQDFQALRESMSAVASRTGTKIAIDAHTHARPRSATPTTLRSVSTIHFTRAATPTDLSKHRDRLRNVVDSAAARVASNAAACRAERRELRTLEKRAVDMASRNALGIIQDLQHTKITMHHERRTSALSAMAAVTEAMEACLAPALSVDAEIAALEHCFAVVEARSAALEGGGLVKATEFVCRMRPRHGYLLREQQRGRRERILHLRHRVTHDLPPVEVPAETFDSSDDEEYRLLKNQKPVTDAAKRRVEAALQAHRDARRDAVTDLFATVAPAALDAAKTQSAAGQKAGKTKPGSAVGPVGWSDTKLARLMRRHQQPDHDRRGELYQMNGRLTWSSTGKAVGASAEELASKLVGRGYFPSNNRRL
jgi:hypothetical protein